MPYFHQVFQPGESPYYDTYYRGDARVSIKRARRKQLPLLIHLSRSGGEEDSNVDLARSEGEIRSREGFTTLRELPAKLLLPNSSLILTLIGRLGTISVALRG